MTPTSLALQYALLGENVAPSIIDERSEELIYVGYCLPSCTSAFSDKWLIKRITKNGTLQAITYPFGSREYQHNWRHRESYPYAISPEQENYNPTDYR